MALARRDKKPPKKLSQLYLKRCAEVMLLAETFVTAGGVRLSLWGPSGYTKGEYILSPTAALELDTALKGLYPKLVEFRTVAHEYLKLVLKFVRDRGIAVSVPESVQALCEAGLQLNFESGVGVRHIENVTLEETIEPEEMVRLLPNIDRMDLVRYRILRLGLIGPTTEFYFELPETVASRLQNGLARCLTFPE